MGDLAKTLTGGLWKFVYAWLLPSALTVTAFWLLVVPAFPASRKSPTGSASDASELTLGVVLALIALAVALLLALNSTFFHRIFEGYVWPTSWFDAGCRRQLRRRNRLQRALDSERHRARMQLLQERLELYPEYEQFILPTRFGNAVRSMETYSKTRYRLDVRSLWQEFKAVAPEPLLKQVEDAEAVVNFFLGSVCLAALFAVLAIGIGLSESDARAVIAGVIAVPLARLLYLGGVQSVRAWRDAIQALISLGRWELAKAYGLKVPERLVDERLMWQTLVSFIAWGDKDEPAITLAPERYEPGRFGVLLDKYRLEPDEAGDPPPPSADPKKAGEALTTILRRVGPIRDEAGQDGSAGGSSGT